MGPVAATALVAEQLRAWKAHDGEAIEASLASGAVALVDAHWLILFAKAGGRILPRAELPSEAFMALDELKAAGNPNGLFLCAGERCEFRAGVAAPVEVWLGAPDLEWDE